MTIAICHIPACVLGGFFSCSEQVCSGLIGTWNTRYRRRVLTDVPSFRCAHYFVNRTSEDEDLAIEGSLWC